MTRSATALAGMVLLAVVGGTAHSQDAGPMPAADRARTPQAKSAAEWRAAVPDIRRRMELVMGPLPGAEKRVPLDVETVSEERGDVFLRRKLRYTPDPRRTGR